ncbi:MAG: GFA family protein [Rhodobacteraceae bacterium]|jgi:hypothetical protein|nr:GFA family protein [Paracoccaceae bacterium]MBL4556988.1 GFA family protein [Paracoccaceae bacterium]HBG98022.1 aldehyde-activating protein [Paracoccaceae bacterium]
MPEGSCLCGAVAFVTGDPVKAPAACHCSQCRKISGHYWAALLVDGAALRLIRDDGLRWFQSSENTRRGFCSRCGTPLFWDHAGEDTISVSMGAFDAPTGLTLRKHIHCASKGDYYALTDGVPQEP